MRAPYFSIVTVTKDNLAGLENTAHSIALQNSDQWRDYEWIVIDGASNDETVPFLKEQNKKGLNVNWISEPDDGLYEAMNKGIDQCQGIYIIFMNAGDIFCDADTLEKIQQLIDEPLPDLIYGDALEEDKNGVEYYKKAKSHKRIVRGLFTHHQAIFYRRDKIKTLRYSTTYRFAADYDFTLRFLKKNPYAHYIDTPICVFETGGLSQRNAAQSREEEFHIRKSQNVPFYKNILVTFRQACAYFIRQLYAPIYWKIRERF